MTGAPAEWPPLLVLTDRRQSEAAGRPLVETVRSVCAAGVPLAVVFREKDLPAGARRALGRQVAAIVEGAGLPLIVASDAALAADLGAVAVHLAAADAVPTPLPTTSASASTACRWGRSCHNRSEIGAAAAEGASYVTASPVFATRSKPGYGPGLGASGLAGLVAAAGGVPVYGLGGIEPELVAACVEAGAAGVAVMGAVMRAGAPAAVVAAMAGSLPSGAAR